MKCTYVGTLPIPSVHDTYVAFRVQSAPPATGIAKDLPPLPHDHHEVWTLFVTKKQWSRVAPIFHSDRAERAVAEGIAVCGDGHRCLWVTNLKSVSMEQTRQVAQKAAAQVI